MGSIKKIPPNSLEAEQSVIGSIITDNDALIVASSLIDSNDFYHPDIKVIYQGIVKLHQLDKCIDLVTLQEYLNEVGQLEQVGGVKQLGRLAIAVPTSAHVKDYALIVKKHSHDRQIMVWANNILHASYEDKMMLLQTAPSVTTNKHQHRKMSELMKINIANVIKRYEGADDIRGIRTGFVDLDNLTDGLKKGEVIGMWADANVGKSILASDIARNVCRKYGAIAFFAYEMSAEDMSYRTLADEMRLPINVFNRPKVNITEKAISTIKQYDEKLLDNLHIFAEELESFTVGEIEAHIKLIDNLQLIIVDYLHLMETTQKYDKSIDKPAVISRELKKLARKYNVPVMALMSQTKGSQDTSQFVGTNELKHAVDQLWRLERDHESADPNIRQAANLFVVKGRGNQKGRVQLFYQEDYLTFKSAAR